MRDAPVRFLVASLAVLGATLAARGANACSCVEPPPPAQALEKATVVFEGTITKLEEGGGPSDLFNRRASFHVLRAWKGTQADSTIVIAMPGPPSSCDIGVASGQSWLIYASTFEGALVATGCDRSRRSEQAAADVAALGAPVSEVGTPTAPPPGGLADSGCAVGGGSHPALVAGLLGLAALLSARRWRPGTAPRPARRARR
jgi:hypothetical protein